MKLKLKISGSKVHDVGYRAFLLEAAEDLGLIGFYARNVTEDSLPVVIACLEGDVASLAEFQCIVRSQRPDKADVSDIVFSEHSGLVEDIGVFSSRFQARQLRKGISSIIRMEEKQDSMLEKQDRMLEMQERMLEKQDQMVSLQSKTIEKLDETRAEIVGKLDEARAEIVGKLDETRAEIVGKLDEARVEITGEIGRSTDVIAGKLDENQKTTVKAIRDSSEVVVEVLQDTREDTVQDIRDLRVDLRSSLDKKLSRMEKDISQLKARSGA